MNAKQDTVWVLLPQLGVAALAPVVAVPARKYLLASSGTHIAWVNFCTAVVLVSLYGGWRTGLLTAAATCCILACASPWLVPQPFIRLNMAKLETGRIAQKLAPLRLQAALEEVAEEDKRAYWSHLRQSLELSGVKMHVPTNESLASAFERIADPLEYSTIRRTLQNCNASTRYTRSAA